MVKRKRRRWKQPQKSQKGMRPGRYRYIAKAGLFWHTKATCARLDRRSRLHVSHPGLAKRRVPGVLLGLAEEQRASCLEQPRRKHTPEMTFRSRGGDGVAEFPERLGKELKKHGCGSDMCSAVRGILHDTQEVSHPERLGFGTRVDSWAFSPCAFQILPGAHQPSFGERSQVASRRDERGPSVWIPTALGRCSLF